MLFLNIIYNIQTNCISGADSGFIFFEGEVVELLWIQHFSSQIPGGMGERLIIPTPPDLDRPMYLNRHAYLYLLLVNSQYASIICSLSLPRMLILFYHRAVFKKKKFKCYFLKIIVCLWWHKLCEFNFCNTTPFNILIWSHPENL